MDIEIKILKGRNKSSLQNNQVSLKTPSLVPPPTCLGMSCCVPLPPTCLGQPVTRGKSGLPGDVLLCTHALYLHGAASDQMEVWSSRGCPAMHPCFIPGSQ